MSVRTALFNLGFRPFYLLAALFAALAVPAWVADLSGHGWPARYLEGLVWHQHEMVFGFALAVIAGFLLTAGRVWTGRATPSGAPLALLAAHWLAARVLVVTGPPWLAALVDGAFPFVVAFVLGRVIFAARNARNYFVPALIAVLGLVNAGFHLSALGLIDAPPSLWAQGGLFLELLLLMVMAGRVVPSFTASALPQAKLHRSAALDYAALALSAIAFACALGEVGGWLGALPAFAAAALHAGRQAGWAPLATRGRPILWILHLSHAWIPVGFVLLGLAAFGLVIGAAPL
ncbi:MAG TPA: NnrS family protein, partial [Burkholderiales bacterium]|nr:NnrS family protein [Burkholderiales bacterium]